MMTWPSSAPSRRTSRASGSRAPAEPIPVGSAARVGEASRRSGARRRDRQAHPQPRQDRTATFGGRNLSYPCIVMTMAPRTEDPIETLRPAPTSCQLRFLHEVARLATTARTWDELLETVVDGTRDALHADVSSLYLLDRDGAYLTLAATNGLDRFQIGRARVPFGEGVTGHVAADRNAAGHPRRQGRPALPVGPRHRPAPVREPPC